MSCGQLGVARHGRHVPLDDLVFLGEHVAVGRLGAGQLADPLVEVAAADDDAETLVEGRDAQRCLAAIAEAVEADSGGVHLRQCGEPVEHDAVLLADQRVERQAQRIGQPREVAELAHVGILRANRRCSRGPPVVRRNCGKPRDRGRFLHQKARRNGRSGRAAPQPAGASRRASDPWAAAACRGRTRLAGRRSAPPRPATFRRLCRGGCAGSAAMRSPGSTPSTSSTKRLATPGAPASFQSLSRHCSECSIRRCV